MAAQLALANANRRRAGIVVLADRDKVEMEDELLNVGDSELCPAGARAGGADVP